MTRRRKTKRGDRAIFDSIRKPVAPPSRKFGSNVPEQKLRPSLRKAKHKKNPLNEEG